MLVTRLRTALGLILVALWIPSTAHCLFEGAGVMEADECCKSESPGQPAAPACADACATLESGAYRLPKALKLTVMPVVAEFRGPDTTLIVAAREPVLPAVESDSLGRRPPWQFTWRAALPARAP